MLSRRGATVQTLALPPPDRLRTPKDGLLLVLIVIGALSPVERPARAAEGFRLAEMSKRSTLLRSETFSRIFLFRNYRFPGGLSQSEYHRFS